MTSKEEPIQVHGIVRQLLPDTLSRVELPNGHVVLAHLSARMKKSSTNLAIGDLVQLEMNPFDLGKARIIASNPPETTSPGTATSDRP